MSSRPRRIERGHSRLSAAAGLVACLVLTLQAQEPRFDVASVKANRSGQPYVGGPGDRFDHGQFQTTNIPLRLLIRQTFERYLAGDVVGGPAWLDSDRWNIVAKAESPDAVMLPMIRSLLVERFRLAFHLETRDRPVYLLTVASPGRLGAALRPSNESVTTFLGSGGTLTGRGITLRQLTGLLGTGAGRTVLDRTGLTGTYDIDLQWTPVQALAPAADPAAAPDIFTAVREQLGLRLDASRGPVETLVIDRAEKPADD